MLLTCICWFLLSLLVAVLKWVLLLIFFLKDDHISSQLSVWLIRRTESLNLIIHNAFFPLWMLIVFVTVLCMFSNFQHLFLSINHGTARSISVSLITIA